MDWDLEGEEGNWIILKFMRTTVKIFPVFLVFTEAFILSKCVSLHNSLFLMPIGQPSELCARDTCW